MKKLQLFFLCLSLNFCIQADDCCCNATEICCPCYSGGFYLDGAWRYLRSYPTDGDLELGTLITLTLHEPNLNAHLQEVRPSFQNGYLLNLGYRFPCSNQSLELQYFSSHYSDSKKANIQTENQIIQNFLGASYSTARARSKQEIDQVGLYYHSNFLVDQSLEIEPYLGVAYGNIRRDFDVKFTDLVANPTPSGLSGEEKSKYWGVGPMFGSEFQLPLFCNFGISGDFGVGVLFGKIQSKLNSNSFSVNTRDSFSARFSEDYRAITVLNGDLALFYSQEICNNWGFKIQAGYAIDYYFKGINRINPNNGYVNNSNSFPVSQSSNLGLGGPYVLVSIDQSIFPCTWNALSECEIFCPYADSGLFFNFTSSWLEPKATNKDLVYGVLTNPGGLEKNLAADPDFTWAGTYELGYRFCNANDLRFKYFGFDSSDRTSTFANANEEISSVNASGPFFVTFSDANSRVKYRLDQFEGTIGKHTQLSCNLNLRPSVGLRYLRLDRKISNQYLGGTPPATTEEKFPVLKSRFRGIGPMFAFEQDWNLFHCFSLVGKLGMTFLVGDLKSTLDQQNFGDLGPSSNTLRTPNSPYIVPVFDGQVGLKFYSNLSDCFSIDIEGGYQYTAYYRGVRLVLPNLLTGLEQINSNLILEGPYFSVGIGAQF